MNKGTQAQILNGLLSDSAVYAVNEKSVNQIFLQTLALGNMDLSETQITVLQGIAEGCPLSDGESVLRARAMLQLAPGTQMDYDDISICGGGERSENNKMVGQTSIRIYPNPAKDVLSIDYEGIGDLSAQFMLLNAQGQMVRIITLPPNQGIIQLPLNGLPGGIYWYAVPGMEAGKILIQH